MCAYKRKTWVEKRDLAKEVAIKTTDRDFADIKAGEKMLIPTPKMVDEYIRHISKEKETTLAQMRKDLAAACHADKTCPVTSGIFIRIAAEAAHEEYLNGKPIGKITPFWRIMDEQSPAAKKLSFGVELLKEQRSKEKLPVR